MDVRFLGAVVFQQSLIVVDTVCSLRFHISLHSLLLLVLPIALVVRGGLG
jgi:hypothetical protein